MKKIFTLIACAVMACSAMAAESVDLTKDMFHKWTGYYADATVDVADGGSAYDLNASTGLVYGTGAVWGLHYADLSDYAKLIVTVTDGTPRCMFNRPGDDGAMPVETPRDAKYQTENGTVYTINLSMIKAEYGYVHLQAIKGANWANTTVTSMQVVPMSEAQKALEKTINDAKELSKTLAGDNKAKLDEATDVATGYFIDIEAGDEAYTSAAAALQAAIDAAKAATSINAVSVAPAKVAKAMENGKVVIVKNGKKFNVAGQAL